MLSLRLLPLTALAACGLAPTWEGMEPADPAPVGSAELRDYKEAHYRAMGERFVATLDFDEFGQRVADSNILLLGDRHGEQALHSAQLELLARLAVESDRPMQLCLEAVGIEDEPTLERFMQGEIGIDELRATVAERWPQSWLENEGLDQDFYLQLLRFAHDHCTGLHAIEPTPRPPLAKRDAGISEQLDRIHAESPDQLLVVVVGHVHLCGEGHLLDRLDPPTLAIGARLSRALQRQLDDQDPLPDDVWFEQTDRGLLLFAPARLRPTEDPAED